MVEKKNKVCPFCSRRLMFNNGIRNRLKKYGKTEVKCIGCGEWFELVDVPKESKIDRRRKEYKDVLLREDYVQFGESN